VILFGLVFLILFYSLKLYFVYREANRPTVTYTNPVFGPIAAPRLTELTSSAGYNFILDTIEGVPVTATGSAAVYFLPDIPTRFGYREKIYLMAKTFGFDTETVKHTLSGKLAEFKDGRAELTVDIGNFNFKYANNIKIDSLVTGSVNISKTDILNKAVDFLRSTGRYPEELSRGTTNVIYLKYDAVLRDFINVERVSEASAVEVDFYRPSINDLPIATPRFFNSQNFVIMNFNQGEAQIIRAQMSFFEKSEEQYGVYPLKSGQVAWQELTDGRGMIVAGTTGIKDITIKKMFPAYLDPDTYQSYLQPVYIFLGESDFVAYVPAVK
jgi:hypothetical protein